jgi:hypothetical protein
LGFFLPAIVATVSEPKDQRVSVARKMAKMKGWRKCKLGKI